MKPVVVGRMEKDTSKLTALYEEGYAIAENMIAGRREYIKRK